MLLIMRGAGSVKLVTLINNAYVPITINFYKQILKVGIKEEFIIYCSDNITYKAMLATGIKCNIKLYDESMLYGQHLLSGNNISHNNINNTLRTNSSRYAYLQMIKHHLVLHEMTKHMDMYLLVDTDMVLFDNFLEDLQSLIRLKDKHDPFENKPAIYGLKYYLNFNRNLKTEGNSGIRFIINTGFMLFNSNQGHCQKITKDYLDYLNLYKCTNKSANIDEFLLTNFFDNRQINVSAIPDSIHLLSNKSQVYQPNQMTELKHKTKSFHLTFVQDKITFLKEANQWYV